MCEFFHLDCCWSALVLCQFAKQPDRARYGPLLLGSSCSVLCLSVGFDFNNYCNDLSYVHVVCSGIVVVNGCFWSALKMHLSCSLSACLCLCARTFSNNFYGEQNNNNYSNDGQLQQAHWMAAAREQSRPNHSPNDILWLYCHLSKSCTQHTVLWPAGKMFAVDFSSLFYFHGNYFNSIIYVCTLYSFNNSFCSFVVVCFKSFQTALCGWVLQWVSRSSGASTSWQSVDKNK